MLNVSDAIKKSYLQDNISASLKLVINGTTYTSRNLTSGSVTLIESLCSSAYFDLKSVEKNEFKFTLFNENQTISNLLNQTVIVSHHLELETPIDIPLGTFTIVEAIKNSDYLYDCTCYDSTMLKLDQIIDTWWNEQITFPITLRDLTVSLFTHLNISHNLPNTFNNSDYSIQTRPTYFDGVTGTEVLGYIQEVIGGFLKADRYGVIQLLMPTVTENLVPSLSLYPKTNLYPSEFYRAIGTSSLSKFSYVQIIGDLEIADYDTPTVHKVQIKNSEYDVGIIVDDGTEYTDTYVVNNNPLLFDVNLTTGQTVAQNILSIVSKVKYTPFSGSIMSQPYIEVGDAVRLTTYKGTQLTSLIFQRTLHGPRVSIDDFLTEGIKEGEKVSGSNGSFTVVNKRTHDIVNTVDEMRSNIKVIKNEVDVHETEISQNADSINLTAKRSGIYNLLVNSDFSNQTDRLRGWVKSSTITGAEYVYDENFIGNSLDLNKIEDGNCLQLTTDDTNVNAYIYQEVNYDGVIESPLQFQVTYRLDTWDNTAVIQPYVQVFDANGNQVLFVYVCTQFTTGGTRNTRSKLTDTSMQALSGVNISKIRFGVWVSNAKSGVNVIKINHLMLTFGGTDLLPYYSWTNSASKDVISQINLSPDGLKINAKKISLSFGSAQSEVHIQSTTQNDGVSFVGTGKVNFETNGEFYVGNINTNSKLANNIRLNTSNYPYIRIVNYQKDNDSTEYVASSIYLKQTSDINSFDFYNNRKSSNTNLETATANHMAMYAWETNSASVFRVDNYHWNGNIGNYLSMRSDSNESSFTIQNNNSSGNARSWLSMAGNGTVTLAGNTGGSSYLKINSNGNMDVRANNDLVLYAGARLCIDGSHYGAGGDSEYDSPYDNPAVKNWDGSTIVLHFYKGIYTGYSAG